MFCPSGWLGNSSLNKRSKKLFSVKVARPSFFLAIPINFETPILKGIKVNDKTTISHALRID